MDFVSIHELRGKKGFLKEIRWDVTPKILLEPRSASSGGSQSTDGYMFYIEVLDTKPVLVIMKNRFSMSKTVAYVTDIPGDLLREAANCSSGECVAGMYPLTGKLEEWLKRELGIS